MKLLGDLVSVRMVRDAGRLRALLRAGLHYRRVVGFGGGALVLGAAQVREVFERDTELRFGAPSDSKMKLGPFILGMDDCPAYQRQKAELRAALTRHPGAFAPIVSAASLDAAGRLPSGEGQQVDLLADFVDPVVTRFSSQFYGVPSTYADGTKVRSALLDLPDGEAVLGGWLRILGAIVVSSTPAPFGLEQVADAVADEFRAHLVDVAGRTDPAQPHEHGSVIAQLKAQNVLSDEEIASSVGGLMLAGRTVGRSFLFALHQLLLRPEQRDQAVGEARAGNRDLLLGYMLEALRFQPPFQFLPRYAARPTTLATGTPEQTRIAADAKVLISPMAAMLDPAAVEYPDEFNPSRPRSVYLHYATGRHVCLGDWIANIALTEMSMALLALPGVAGAQAGVFRYRGPLVDRYRIKLARSRA